MIMLAKVDGKIEDQEKLFLAQEISGISEFTVNEKKAFFSLMDSASLPDLEKNDIVFYSVEAYQSVISKLESLAGKDGEIEGSEKDFIEKIKSMNIEFSKPKK
jgi:tellurite resistance protein